jgi:hypothetical protein
MMRNKLQLFLVALLGSLTLSSQTPQNYAGSCGVGAPAPQWEQWMQEKIQEYKEGLQNGNRVFNTTIPVIVHVIHTGETYGTFPNVDSNQIKTQIAILNKDFAGIGVTSGSVPAVFANLKSNTGITFCLATKDPQDNPLTERGVRRVNANVLSWLSPGTPTLDLKAYFYSTIMPATIWDPTKYLNIWISDKPPGYPLNGFGTYPAASALSGLWGTNFGTATNDGIWVYTKAFGDIGVVSPTDFGRTATHELGHWLGLRHIWGDGNCLSDYVNDTPQQKQANGGVPTHPLGVDQCGANTAPNGVMFMNFMDMTDDITRYMFTHEQNIRMQTALSQSPFRNALGTHGKCTLLPAPASSSAIASFNLNGSQCLNNPFYPYNTSSGSPSPNFLWSASPAVNFTPNATVANPGVIISNPGTYTLSLVASNSVSSSSYSMIVTAFGNCTPLSPCIDTLKAIKDVDSLTTIRLANDPTVSGCQSGFAGYLAGTNCYRDKEFAQYFSPLTYTSVPFPQVNSVIVLFDSIGTKAANGPTQITCKLYGGSVTQGPGGLIQQRNDSLGKIASTPGKLLNIGYVGKPNFTPLTNTKIIPFKFDFASPVLINSTSGFFAAVQTPTNNVPGDSINIFTNTRYNSAVDSSAWFLQLNNSWKPFRSGRKAKVQLAILPQITCSGINGIADQVSELQKGFMILPNPGSGMFQLIFTLSSMQDLRLSIRNSMGQELMNSEINNVMYNVLELDLSRYNDGIYFAEISGSGEKVVKKIVLKH